MSDRHRPWSKKELRILTHYYPTEGAIAVQRRLARAGFSRTVRAVTGQAQGRMITVGDVTGHIAVADLVGNSRNADYYRALFYACRDGVLRTLVSGRRKYIVPVEWADEHMARRDAKATAREESGS